MQKELSKLSWFAEWYEPWQERMRANARIRWLVEARNRVEKQGDLETASEAFVSLVSAADDVLVARVEVAPLASPADIAAAVNIDNFDEEVRKACVLVVERRWTVPELPEDELLDVIAYCYGVLATLVREAHERCGVTMQVFGGEAHEGLQARRPHPSGRLPCMIATAQHRTANWHLGSASLLRVISRERVLERGQDFSDVEARYGPLPDLSSRTLHPDLPPIEHARYFHEMAKMVIAVDQLHWPMAFLFRDGSQIDLQVFTPDDQQEKIVMMRQLAAEVAREAVDMVIYTTEIWTAPAVRDPATRAPDCARESAWTAPKRFAPTSCNPAPRCQHCSRRSRVMPVDASC